MTTYPNPDILVSTGWLAEHLDEPGLRIVDCRPAEPYLAGHIPGAVGQHDAWLKNPADPHNVVTPAQAADIFGYKLGIGPDTPVIVYDGQGGVLAARVWWVLDYYGHTNVQLLDGGWAKWLAEGRPVSTRAVVPAPADFEPAAPAATRCDLADVKAALDRDDVIIWDVRRVDEWEGRLDQPAPAIGHNPRLGRLPGAVWANWYDVLTPGEVRTFLPPDDIQRLLDGLGLSRDTSIITHCQAGIRAAHGVFTLRLMGYPDARVYDGSFGEWSRDPTAPLVTSDPSATPAA